MIARYYLCLSATVLVSIAAAAAFRGGGEEKKSDATYYISPAGADSNPGSREKPWKTLHKAYTEAQPGDTIVLSDGVYREAPFDFNKSGTADKPIRFHAASGAFPILTYPESGPAMSKETFDVEYLGKVYKGKKVVVYKSVADLTASHLRFRGITFQGWRDQTEAVSLFAACSGVEMAGAKDVVFQHCTFRGNGHCGVKVDHEDIRFEDCLIHDNGTTGFDHGFYIDRATRVTIKRCTIERNQGIGIKCAHGAPSYLTIEDNTIRNNGAGILIEGPHITVRRNVFAWNARKDCGEDEPIMGGLIFRGRLAADSLVEDNVFLANCTDLLFDPQGAGLGKANRVRNNIFASRPVDLAADGVRSPKYPYQPVLTNEQAITTSRKWGMIVLGKTKDNEERLRRDLKDKGFPAAFSSVDDPQKYQLVFEGNIFQTSARK